MSLSLSWRYVPGGVIRGPVLPGPAGAVYFLADDWYLYRVDPDGTLGFRFDLGAAPEPTLAPGPGGSVIAATSDGNVVAVDSDGRAIWRSRAGGAARIKTLLSDSSGYLFAAVSDRRIACLNMSGRTLWSLDFDSALLGISAGPGGGIVCNDAAGRVYRLDRWGNVVWSVLLDGRAEAISVDVVSGRVYVLERGENLVCIDSGGAVLRRMHLGAVADRVDVSSTPTVFVGTDGAVYALPGDGGIYAFAADGSRQFVAFPPEGRFTGCAIIPSGGIFAVTSDGSAVVLDASGVARLSVRTPEPTSLGQPWLAGPNRIVSGGTNWVTYAFELKGGLAVTTRQSESNGGPNWAIPRPESFRDIPDFISLQSRLSGSDQLDRQHALNELVARVAEHRLRRSLPYVTYLLGGIVTNRTGSAGAGSPADAVAASNALGRIGTPWARTILLSAARAETDSTVVASVVEALALCGPDWDGEVQQTLLWLLRAGGAASEAPRVREAIGSALGRLRLKAGRLTPAGVEALVRLQTMSGNPKR